MLTSNEGAATLPPPCVRIKIYLMKLIVQKHNMRIFNRQRVVRDANNVSVGNASRAAAALGSSSWMSARSCA